MATELLLTDGVVRGVQGSIQPLSQAVDVSAFDQADLLLTVCGVEGAVTTFTLVVLGGMATESEDGWWPLATFANIVTSNPGTTYANLDKKVATGLLKFLRWKVIAVTGGTAVSFTVRGMLRSN